MYSARIHSIFLPSALLTAAVLITSEPAVIAKSSGAEKKAAEERPKKFTSVSQVVKEYGQDARARLKPLFNKKNVDYPPAQMSWLALKKEKLLILFAPDRNGKLKQLLKYEIIGASGSAGPKLKEGDKQVPEGFYKLNGFRPNVIAHLGLSVDYPNSEDLAHAKKEGRKTLGGDILIHGSRWSTGCLAMGNPAIEELFVLAYDCGLSKIKLIFAPCNLLVEKPEIDLKKNAAWLSDLYQRLTASLHSLPINTE